MAKGETYEEFVEKFKPKLTTDDCYTPENIYEAVAGWVAEEYGVDLRIMPEECTFVSKLDVMGGKTIFGGGYLLSTRAAAERAAAERAAAEMARATRWELSEREKGIVRAMGRGDENAGMEGRQHGANGERGAAAADAVGGDGERGAP